MKHYERIAEELTRLIESRSFPPGARMPSVRRLSRAHAASPGTVLRAYALLEDRGLIAARPRSGYFVRSAHPQRLPEPSTRLPAAGEGPVDINDLVFHVLESVKDRRVTPFGSAFPSPALFPFKALSAAFAAATRQLDPARTVESLPPGNPALRGWLSRRYLESGCVVEPDDIVITSGALEALNLCLQAVTQPGDIVAVESPAFYGALQAIETLGLHAVEVPTDPRYGVDVDALARILQTHPIRACWFMTSFQNPLGFQMPDDNKRALVALLARHDVPLIEDDVYAELYLRGPRPTPAKAFDRKGLVLHCASFSKSLAPGFRVGWVAPGRFRRQITRRQLTTTLATTAPTQWAIVEYLRHGGFDRHLRGLRQTLMQQQCLMSDAIERHFPAGTRLSRPSGGYFLWVELPEAVDALDLHRRATEAGVSVSPGPMFSAKRHYTNCLRLNYGHPDPEAIASGVQCLGALLARGQVPATPVDA
ncbi:MAG: PLP-dependent aminotransferase family protein [Algiphilus sp.]|uniref:aminotransferase-like domain-containing protein n=1 Tax=Algiphilus sp. TaxID=1872431 RepID=UPI0025BACC9B|nr:PLP-dependent aminotransferase family protein [Algiphilus sp.]MCI5103549.1 PLP-dependent aminotransferase family protein [Algiphilus sp.]